MVLKDDKKCLSEGMAHFIGMGTQIHYILDANYDKFKTSQVTRFVNRYKEIVESVSFVTKERALVRVKEEEEIRCKYKGSEAQNRLASAEANANIAHGKTLTEAGDKIKDICDDMRAAVAQTTPVKSTVKKLSKQKMSPTKSTSPSKRL